MLVYLTFNISLKLHHFAPLKLNILYAHLVLVNWPQIVYKFVAFSIITYSTRWLWNKTFDACCWKLHRCKLALNWQLNWLSPNHALQSP